MYCPAGERPRQRFFLRLRHLVTISSIRSLIISRLGRFITRRRCPHQASSQPVTALLVDSQVATGHCTPFGIALGATQKTDGPLRPP